MKLKNIRFRISYYIFIIVICFIVIKFLIDDKIEIYNIIITLATIIGSISIWYEIKNGKDLNEAEFIFNLNQSFFSNENIQSLYLKLEKIKDEQGTQKNSEVKILSDDVPTIVQYLTYFYSIQSALDKGIIDMKTVNTIFSYRFFLIVHNKQIQDMELIKDDIYYKNIYILHDYWTKYRKKRKLSILNEKNSLYKRNPNYNKLAK